MTSYVNMQLTSFLVAFSLVATYYHRRSRFDNSLRRDKMRKGGSVLISAGEGLSDADRVDGGDGGNLVIAGGYEQDVS